MKIQLLTKAEQDLIDAAEFYETQQPGLGQYFLDSVFEDIDTLALRAGVHAKVFGFHRLLARHFPYAVYYQVSRIEIALIYAVLDCRQSPYKTESRLQQPN